MSNLDWNELQDDNNRFWFRVIVSLFIFVVLIVSIVRYTIIKKEELMTKSSCESNVLMRDLAVEKTKKLLYACKGVSLSDSPGQVCRDGVLDNVSNQTENTTAAALAYCNMLDLVQPKSNQQ